MGSFLSVFPLTLILLVAGPEAAKNLAGKVPPPDSDPLNNAESEKISPACQANSLQARIGDSSSINAVRLSAMISQLLLRRACELFSDSSLSLTTRDDEIIVFSIVSPRSRRHLADIDKLPIGYIGRR
jgi:hypothetical protein